MGIRFCNRENQTLSDMSNGRAHLFIEIGELAAQRYRLTTGFADVVNSECVVEEKQFCRLVEAVFANPINLLYVWAQEATAIYEVIKGRRFQWLWRERDTPHFPFRSIQRVDLVPEIEE